MSVSNRDHFFLRRCCDLAHMDMGGASPNPKVGALLVCQNRVIGEGFHRKYGQAHAEVAAVNSVADSERKYIPDSTLYVSLEPCSFTGNTPPCTELILRNKIKKVVIGQTDPHPRVEGSGSSNA